MTQAGGRSRERPGAVDDLNVRDVVEVVGLRVPGTVVPPGDVLPDEVFAVLDNSDWRQLRKRTDPIARTVSALGRWLTRMVIAEMTGVAPVDLVITRTCGACGAEHGKPRLVAPSGLDLSVSHAGEMIALAVSRSGKVGIDLEPTHRVRSITEAAPVAFSPSEILALARLAPGVRAMTMLRMWCSKEAILKSTGEGMSRDPSELTLSCDPGTTTFRSESSWWTLQPIDLDPLHVCVLATERSAPIARSRMITLPPYA